MTGFAIERVYEAAERWKEKVSGNTRLWLCWNVSPRWCQLQQRLIRKFGWTPVVGFDPRTGPPPIEPGAILIDFNESFGFPVLWPHFPLEFAFLWTSRLAFWHADLLCRPSVMENLATRFASIQNGEMTAVLDKGGMRNFLNFRQHRYWELCGCTTQAASENQFFNGVGWWRHFEQHIKCVLEKERERRRRYSYDSGVGIQYWSCYYNGAVKPIDIKLVEEGHCSEIKSRNYKPAVGHTTALRSLTAEIDMNYSLDEVARRLEISDLL